MCPSRPESQQRLARIMYRVACRNVLAVMALTHKAKMNEKAKAKKKKTKKNG